MTLLRPGTGAPRDSKVGSISAPKLAKICLLNDAAAPGTGAPRYCGRIKTLVCPPPTSVALSALIATTRKSPNLSPTNKVLPLIIAEGRVRRKTMACNLGGAGFGAGSITGTETGALCWTAGIAEVEISLTGVVALATKFASVGGGGCGALAGAETGGGAGTFAVVVVGAADGSAGAVLAATGLVGGFLLSHCHINKPAKISAMQAVTINVRLGPRLIIWAGSTGLNSRLLGGGGGVSS